MNIYVGNNSYQASDEDLEYVHNHLPTFLISQGSMTDIDYAIHESIICQQSEYFIGSDTSLYSTYIIGERLKTNKENYEIFKK